MAHAVMRLIFWFGSEGQKRSSRGLPSILPDMKSNQIVLKNSNNLHLSVCLYPDTVSTSQNAAGFMTNGFFQTSCLLMCSMILPFIIDQWFSNLSMWLSTWKLWGFFAEHHEILIYLIPLYVPATILLAENMTILMRAI